MMFDGLTAAQQAAQQKAGRYRDTHRRYGVVADITAAILHQLLLGFFQLLTFFAKRFRSLTGRIGDLIESLMCGINCFVYYFHDGFLSLFESHVILDRIYARRRRCATSTALVISAMEFTIAAQLNLALEGFNVDLGGAQGRLIQYGRLNLGGDDAVVNILSGSLLFLRRCATHGSQ